MSDNTTTGAMIGMITLNNDESVKEDIAKYQELIKRKVACVLRFINWEDDFPTDMCHLIASNGSTPHFTWHANWPTTKGHARRECESNDTGLDDILAGKYDAYITQFATDVKAWGGEVYIRFLHEFNADWYVWSGYKNGAEINGPEKVKQVWKYVVDRFKAIGAHNALWGWCVHEPSIHVPLEPWNDIENYWPGNDYVDWVGIDGFNFYPENPERINPSYLSFDDCFRATYDKIVQLTNKPVFIMTGSGEFLLSDKKTNKTTWVNDAFLKIKTEYPQIKMYCWFNHYFNERADWRIHSSEEVLEAFRNNMDDPYYLSYNG